ncbi:hypothetical protein [Streptomyces sedi]|uniref:Uncharacterized protein n=1 Tax=Streptomyces sedi TaxID=555059 RepID=A0A5C4V8C2_9ACTN|nr:hypothetical protein [Streptomyces sedi]TNM32210.1 hypothetical protein FH715_07370 [Streptomyces sedi]
MSDDSQKTTSRSTKLRLAGIGAVASAALATLIVASPSQAQPGLSGEEPRTERGASIEVEEGIGGYADGGYGYGPSDLAEEVSGDAAAAEDAVQPEEAIGGYPDGGFGYGPQDEAEAPVDASE